MDKKYIKGIEFFGVLIGIFLILVSLIIPVSASPVVGSYKAFMFGEIACACGILEVVVWLRRFWDE